MLYHPPGAALAAGAATTAPALSVSAAAATAAVFFIPSASAIFYLFLYLVCSLQQYMCDSRHMYCCMSPRLTKTAPSRSRAPTSTADHYFSVTTAVLFFPFMATTCVTINTTLVAALMTHGVPTQISLIATAYAIHNRFALSIINPMPSEYAVRVPITPARTARYCFAAAGK